MFTMTKAIREFKELIDSRADPTEVYDTSIFGVNYKYAIPLFCAENNYECMYQPSRLLYIIFRTDGDNCWKKI